MQLPDDGKKFESNNYFAYEYMSNISILITCILVLAKLLVAPFHYVLLNSFISNAGYSLIWLPPHSTVQINNVPITATVDTLQLTIEIVTLLICGLLISYWAVKGGDSYFSSRAKKWRKLTTQQKIDAIKLLELSTKHNLELNEELVDKYVKSQNIKSFLLS